MNLTLFIASRESADPAPQLSLGDAKGFHPLTSSSNPGFVIDVCHEA